MLIQFIHQRLVFGMKGHDVKGMVRYGNGMWYGVAPYSVIRYVVW